MLVKNLQRQRNFVDEHDFPIQNSYTDRVQRLSHSRDQKIFVTSLVQSAIHVLILDGQSAWPYPSVFLSILTDFEDELIIIDTDNPSLVWKRPMW